ncbi:hypothetical protein ALP8811_02464 [Aliiroseovarius pelagivivens]|uniref:Excinuclease ABC subunit A n=1 Tax=Aliiroseovarius pelagivivens TaxID=1639690 RepID=A0A2R8ARP1_9RHOB|nr:excinuclease ABC subunit A [Aliiroseovarius pelagivivens]SPF78537.1 hypothetical protein ALP8811_02464 [Aliiroseovarius pelagivivens]
MKAPLKAALILALLPLTVGAAWAGNGKAKGHGAAGCPPGLAKKNPPCVPPGLAKPKEGDYVHDYDYLPFTDYDRYQLDPRYSYYRVGEMIYRADPTTFRILEVIGLMDALLR